MPTRSPACASSWIDQEQPRSKPLGCASDRQRCCPELLTRRPTPKSAGCERTALDCLTPWALCAYTAPNKAVLLIPHLRMSWDTHRCPTLLVTCVCSTSPLARSSSVRASLPTLGLRLSR